MSGSNVVRGVLQPSWAGQDSIFRFNELQLDGSDVVMSSYPKTGTTWVNKILFCLLRMDSDGEFPPGLDLAKAIGFNIQTYIDWCPLGRPADPEWKGVGPGGVMGQHLFSDLLDMPRPRIFSTHQPTQLLPVSLTEGHGRLVYVMRNPKDTMVSLHYFRGEPKDGWFGNEHGPGSFTKWLQAKQTYGCFFEHIRGMQNWIITYPKLRCHCVCYEQLHADFRGEATKLAQFLGVGLSERKFERLADLTSFSSMKKSGIGGLLLRKGVCGDWVNAPLSERQWQMIEEKFEAVLGDCPIAQPLRRFMGMPDTDPAGSTGGGAPKGGATLIFHACFDAGEGVRSHDTTVHFAPDATVSDALRSAAGIVGCQTTQVSLTLATGEVLHGAGSEPLLSALQARGARGRTARVQVGLKHAAGAVPAPSPYGTPAPVSARRQ